MHFGLDFNNFYSLRLWILGPFSLEMFLYKASLLARSVPSPSSPHLGARNKLMTMSIRVNLGASRIFGIGSSGRC